MSGVSNPASGLGGAITALPSQFRQKNFTAIEADTAIDLTAVPLKYFALQVKQNGGVTSWDVRLEGSLDGTNFDQILQHTNMTGDGEIVWSGNNNVVRWMRARCAGMVLGIGTSIDCHILGSV